MKVNNSEGSCSARTLKAFSGQVAGFLYRIMERKKARRGDNRS